ncbi:uncharacterized protein LOC118435171 isoform X1 [Folsomia candida]|uniref:uncharacterized protein LOC118435171 isoform X1 n=1 Tax=Folsomia candida TaxID=158441 RepID=UPI0016053E62|nr:uncharacterized protein LOC118435171 isoform X1 [Folsomia candida]
MFKVKSYSYNTSLIYFVHTFRRCVGCKNSDISPLQPPTTAMPMTSCKTPEEDAFYKKYKAECEQIAPVCPTYNQPTQEMGVSTRDFELELDELAEADVDSEHLLAFINRYKDIGGQLYRMFHDRLNEDSQKAQRDHCLDPDQTWYSEHLFKMFINRMDQKESGRPSGTNSAKANSNDTPGSGSKCSAKTIEFDQLSDTRTGAKAVANSDPNVKHYPLVEVGAQKSLSSLVKHCSVPAGTTKPRDNNKYSNNYKVYNAYASTSQMHTCPEFDDFLKNKLLENLQEKKSSEHHASAISRTSSGNNNNTRKYQWQNEDSVNNLTDSMYDMDRPHQFLQKDTIAEDDFNRQFSRRDLSELSHLPHVTQPSESLDQFTRFSHQHENTLEPTRPWYYDDDVGQNMTTLHDNISRDLSQHFTTFPLSIPSETVIADDEFQILHHHRIHARADRHRPPPQFQNARLLIPTYDNNGNFVHYVFQ